MKYLICGVRIENFKTMQEVEKFDIIIVDAKSRNEAYAKGEELGFFYGEVFDKKEALQLLKSLKKGLK